MQTNFSKNIKCLRKEQHITQEQLAAVMGVSAGAIYKWEQRISTPDIGVIMDLVSFFNVSVDALVGYVMYSSDRDRILQELKQIKLQKNYEDCWRDIDGWMRRYPNDFEIVYTGGVLYNLAGIETENKQYLYRSIELLNHAYALIAQNRNPKLSEIAIRQDIAIAHLSIGESDKSLDLLKKNNPCGINDDIIGQELATDPKRRNGAKPYLASALLHCTASLYRVVIGFVTLFFEQEDFHSAIAILTWMISYLAGLNTDKGVSYLDKDKALLLALCGASYQSIGNSDKAKEYIYKARQAAIKFDAAPNYTSQNILYCENAELQAAYDNIGSTAADTILKFLQDGVDNSKESLLKLWEECCDET